MTRVMLVCVLAFGGCTDGADQEPIELLNAGKYDVKVLSDAWTAVTKDRSLSAQFEHTIGVTAEGCEVFTLSPAGLTKPPYS